MKAFDLHCNVIESYKNYILSFLAVKDKRIWERKNKDSLQLEFIPDPFIYSDLTFKEIRWYHAIIKTVEIIQNNTSQEFRYHVLLPEAQRGEFTGDNNQIYLNSPMTIRIKGKQDGDTFEFGGIMYRIVKMRFTKSRYGSTGIL